MAVSRVHGQPSPDRVLFLHAAPAIAATGAGSPLHLATLSPPGDYISTPMGSTAIGNRSPRLIIARADLLPPVSGEEDIRQSIAAT